jgi:hypothetical protein
MKYVIVAPAGENLDALYAGINEFSAERVILITTPENTHHAKTAKKELETFKIPVELKPISNSELIEGMFQAVAEIKNTFKDKEVLINVSTGTMEANCGAICAGYVNGMKAFVVEKNKVKLLPIMKFSYYCAISERKLSILKALARKTCSEGIDALAKDIKMNLPLLSYHINGNDKSEGLKRLGLVETRDIKGKTQVCLTVLGKLLVRGYIPHG